MILDFADIEEKELKAFKGGDKALYTHMFSDDNCKIMQGRLEPGSSIGYHKHETDSEIIFMLKGTGTVLFEDGIEILEAGKCHYCPNGYSHSLRNESNEDIEFWAVVPVHNK